MTYPYTTHNVIAALWAAPIFAKTDPQHRDHDRGEVGDE